MSVFLVKLRQRPNVWAIEGEKVMGWFAVALCSTKTFQPKMNHFNVTVSCIFCPSGQKMNLNLLFATCTAPFFQTCQTRQSLSKCLARASSCVS